MALLSGFVRQPQTEPEFDLKQSRFDHIQASAGCRIEVRLIGF
jgi:hypothetical protein